MGDLGWGKITGSRIVDELALRGEPGAVAGAIPGMLLWIPFQSAAKVGAALFGKTQEVSGGFGGIDKQLRLEHTAAWGDHLGIGISVTQQQVTQQMRPCHSVGHTPFVEAGDHIQVGCVLGIPADIGQAVQGHTVLCGPMKQRLCPRIVPLGKALQGSPAATRLSGAVSAAAQKQQTLVLPEGQAVLRGADIHPSGGRGILQRQHIGPLLIQLEKIRAVGIEKREVVATMIFSA